MVSTALTGQINRSFRFYGTQLFNRSLEEEFPEIRDRREVLDVETQGRLQENFNLKWLEKEIILPVVFHLLIPEGDSSIPFEVLHSQLQATHLHFSKLPEKADHPKDSLTGFWDRAGRIPLDFCFRDPKDQTPWVESKRSPRKEWPVGTDLMRASQGGLEAWDPSRYLNVWIAELEGNVAGFAQYPGGIPDYDGIVIDPDFFGLRKDPLHPYALGKTFTHLLGSYLGLYELWNTYLSCEDDGVEDTPVHNASNYGIPEYMHYSMCPGEGIEMTSNFMDGVDDSEMYLFTWGQVRRIASILFEKGPRSTLTEGVSLCSPVEKMNTGGKQYPFTLSPNPAQGQIFLQWDQSSESELNLIVFNPEGKRVRSLSLSGKAGTNSYTLNLDGLPGGLYILLAQGKDHVFAQRFLLLN
jgi:hypothetical protein